jgi:hypothetical protein
MDNGALAEPVDREAIFPALVADGPRAPSTVRFHTHVECYDGRPWIAAASDAVIVELVE